MTRPFLVILAMAIYSTVFAAEQSSGKKLSLPRFVSIKAQEVNARSGPTINSPIEWVFVRKGEPVEVTAEYEQWRKIRDIKGEGGWVHSSVLSKKRSVIIISKTLVSLYSSPSINSQIIAQLSYDVRCKLNKCDEQHCQISCGNHKGWLSRKALWGIYPNEIVK